MPRPPDNRMRNFLCSEKLVGARIHLEPALTEMPVTPRQREIFAGHLFHQIGKLHLWFPLKLGPCLARIAKQGVHLGGTKIARVDPDQGLVDGRRAALGSWAGYALGDGRFLRALAFPAQFDSHLARGRRRELADAVLLARSDDEVFRLLLLQHQPLHFDIVLCVAPVASGIEVSEIEAVLHPEHDAREGTGDLAGNEGLAPDRGLVIEENAVTRVDAVRLTVVDRNPVRIEFGYAIRAAGIERRRFLLRSFLREAKELGCRSLVVAGLLFQPENSDRFQNPQRAECIGIRGVFRFLERNSDVALRREIVDLARLNLLDYAGKAGRVGEVAVMQDKSPL